MRISRFAAVLSLAAPCALGAQSTVTTTTTVRAETTYVKGTVTGEIPTGSFTIERTTTSYYTIPAPTLTPSTTEMSTMSTMSAMPADTTVKAKPARKTLDRKVSHGVKEAAGDVSKAGKKAAHGVKEAASDVKKKVTGKP